MKKFLLFLAAVVTVTMLSVPTAYAAPSPTEEDVDLTEFEDLDVPLADMEAPETPLAEEDELVEIDDPAVPLAFIPAPQTGVEGLTGMEALALAAMVSTLGGAFILAKTRKQTCSVR